MTSSAVREWEERLRSPSTLRVAETLDADALRQASRNLQYVCFDIDASRIRNKADVMTMFASELRFPDYFGENWDALLDVLRDMSWFDSRGFVLLISNGESFDRLRRDEHRALVDILTQAVSYWREEQSNDASTRPFHVIVDTPLDDGALE